MSKNLLDGPKEYKKEIDNIDDILYRILDDIKKQTVFLSSHNVESLISKGEIVGDDWEIIENERCDEITFSEGDLNLIELAQTPKTSNKKSKQDTSLFKVRYQYAGAKKGERDFCNKVLESDKVYREEDLNANYNYNEELSPSGTDSYNIFLFKGGVNCKHWWQRVVYLKKNNERISVNQARKMILELDPKDRKKASFDKNDKRVAKVAEAQNNYWSLTPNYRDSGVELSAKSKELYQRLAGFDPSQTRGADGKWGSEGGFYNVKKHKTRGGSGIGLTDTASIKIGNIEYELDKGNWGSGIKINISLAGGPSIGYATLDKSQTFFTNIRIDEKHRRKGLGTAIYNFTELVTGVKLKPSPVKMSPSARNFWKKRGVNLSSKVSLKTIDGKKAYKTKEEAKKVAKEMGCDGYHEHKVDDVVYFMPCKSHDQIKK